MTSADGRSTWPSPPRANWPSAESEGACLIDHDERRLLLFCRCDDDQSYRLAALATLARRWPGRRVEWAYGGLEQLKVAAGLAATGSESPLAGEELLPRPGRRRCPPRLRRPDARAAGIPARPHTNNAFTHRPMDLSGEEKALVHAAIADLMA
ncbi:hypothetical protein AB0M50_08505 [Nonomuraea fuscirosea]|uniref:hypothetical protein n=1 Tax=Nonomuraea fuscirosea TaxID=1291556 RepID=UPI00343D05E3